MKKLTKQVLTFFLLSTFLLQACNKSFVVKNVDYSQQIESVLIPNSEGIITDIRNGLSFSILPFQEEEFKTEIEYDSQIKEVRLIRNKNGYYFITADKFKHVYVMIPKKGELKMKKKILIDENGLYSPAFNWREPAVQLIDATNNTSILLTEKGIVKEEVAL